MFSCSAATLKPATLSYGLAAFTLCRNLQSTGMLSFPFFSSTMWVRLCREILSLQLHTVEQWISESWGTEAKNRQGSPTKSFMTGFSDTRESARIRAFTLFSCLSRCWGGDDRWRSIACQVVKKIKYLLFYLQLTYDEAVADFCFPAIAILFCGQQIVKRKRPCR